MDANDKKLAELLEKWRDGNYDCADEQDLQRLSAEGDAFTRDAVDGHLAMPEEDHAQHLASLRNRLSNRTKTRRRPWLTGVFAVAASLALLVTALWWFQYAEETEQVAIIHQDTPTKIADAPVTANGNMEKLPDNQKSVANKPLPTSAKPAPPISPTITFPTVAADIAVADDNVKDVALNDAEAEGRQISDNTYPQTSSNTYPQVPVQRFPPSYSADNAVLKKSENAAVPQKKAQSTRTTSAKPRVAAAPFPAPNWDRFRTDMSVKLHLPQDAKDKGIGVATVTMILDINALQGTVRSVLFVNRVGYGCDELAEQFVQQYKWVVTPGGPSEIEVEVVFR